MLASFGAQSRILLVALLGSAACGGSSKPGLDTKFADPDDPAYAARQDGVTDPRISRSAGVEGGLVVLWPRVVPADGSEDSVAEALQAELTQMANHVRSSERVDVRPSPERTCPRAGCIAPSLSAVLLHKGGGCAVVLALQAAGESETHLVPWLGQMDILDEVIPYREPPESHVRPTDFVRCDEVGSLLTAESERIEAAVRAFADPSVSD
ncbi:MAG: hypothetical protein KC417_12600 [Myxococcales bacterium]|nr:hypothetical protein [Myxococcales bacterium]